MPKSRKYPKRLEVKVKKVKRDSPGEASTGRQAHWKIRRQIKIEERMANVSRLYLDGKLQREIAEELGVSIPTVGNDLNLIRQGWLESALMDFDKRKAQEMAKLDRLEQRALEAYEKTIGTMISIRQKVEKAQPPPSDKGGRPVAKDKWVPKSFIEETLTKQSPGDPKFLEIVRDCIEMRLKIVGGLKAEAPSGGTVVNINWGDMYRAKAQEVVSLMKEDDDEIEREIAKAKLLPPIQVEARTVDEKKGV